MDWAVLKVSIPIPTYHYSTLSPPFTGEPSDVRLTSEPKKPKTKTKTIQQKPRYVVP
jgi:hypothetical protein